MDIYYYTPYPNPNDELYYSNTKENSSWFILPEIAVQRNAIVSSKTVTIKLTNGKFVLPANSHTLFKGCVNTTLNDMDKWDTSEVTTFSDIFRDCFYLQELDLSNFNTSKCTNFTNMFENCKALTELDLRSFDMYHATMINGMFQNCTNLTKITVDYNTDWKKIPALATADTSVLFKYSNKLPNWDGVTNIDRANTDWYFNGAPHIYHRFDVYVKDNDWFDATIYYKDSEGWSPREVYI